MQSTVQVTLTRRGRSPSLFGTAAVITSVVSALTLLSRVATESVHTDEVVYAETGWLYLTGRVAGLPPSDDVNAEHPPLAKYVFGLAQVLVGHPSMTTARVAAVVCVLAAGVALAVLVGRAVDRWAGLAAGALFVLVPHNVVGLGPSGWRHVMLEAVACLFVTLALAAAYRLFARRDGRHRPHWSVWWTAVELGVWIGLATSAKEVAFVPVVGACLAGLVVQGDWRRRAEVTGRLAVAAVVAVAVFIALYLPIGSPIAFVRFMIDFQTEHAAAGHRIQVAGVTYLHPPWWSNLWFLVSSLGVAYTVLMVIGIGAALSRLRRCRLTQVLTGALLACLVVYSFGFAVTLPFYWLSWTPMLWGLTGIGLYTAGRWAQARIGLRPRVLVLALVAVVTVSTVVGTAVQPATGTRPVADIIGADGTSTVLAIDVSRPSLRYYLGEPRVVAVLPEGSELDRLEYVAMSTRPRAGASSARVWAFVEHNVAAGRLELVYQDPDVWLSRKVGGEPLLMPTKEQIADVAGRLEKPRR